MRENLWGVVAVLEDNYMMRNIIYKQAAKKLSIQTDSDEYEWLSTHIKIVSFLDIERCVFRGISLLDSFKKQIEKGNPGDYSLQLHDENIPEIVNDKFLGFRNELRKYYIELASELVKEGIISNQE